MKGNERTYSECLDLIFWIELHIFWAIQLLGGLLEDIRGKKGFKDKISTEMGFKGVLD